MSIKISIGHDTSERSSSLTDGEDSSGTGVQVSPTSAIGSQGYSDSLEENEGWEPIYPDDIGPSDSASRPRTSNQNHRPIVEAPRPEAARRLSTRRQTSHDRVHHRPLPRVHRPPPRTSPESVDSNEDWQGYARGPPPHQGRTYAHWGHAGNPPQTYTPSYSSAPTYSPFPTTSLASAGQQLVPFATPASYGFPPYQTSSGGAAPGYFPAGHHGGAAMGNPMGPHAGVPYGGQDIVHHGPSAGYFPYSQQGYPMPQPIAPPAMYHPYPGVYSPPPMNTPPPPLDTSRDDEKFARLEKLFLDQKAEQEAKEAAAKKAAEDATAKAETATKVAGEIAAAEKKAAAAATEEAEKKAADEKAQSKKATDEAAEKAAAAAAAAAVPPAPPPPEEKKKPIKFKDAVGRKFSFPFHLCNTWPGMEDLIKQAFLHVNVIGPHVAEGHYDLVGPNGEIILPQVWETMLEPDWIITMRMWPIPEPPKVEDLPGEPVMVVNDLKKEGDRGVPPPPPPAPSALGARSDKKKSVVKVQAPKRGPFMSWTTGRTTRTKPAKGKKKLEEVTLPTL